MCCESTLRLYLLYSVIKGSLSSLSKKSPEKRRFRGLLHHSFALNSMCFLFGPIIIIINKLFFLFLSGADDDDVDIFSAILCLYYLYNT